MRLVTAREPNAAVPFPPCHVPCPCLRAVTPGSQNVWRMASYNSPLPQPMQFEDVQHVLTRPAMPLCQDTGTSRFSSATPSVRDDTACRLDTQTASFDEAFGDAIRSSLAPWNSTVMTMQTINMQLLFAAAWCRCQLCIVRGKLYLRGWRRSAAKPGVPSAEFLNGSRHHAAILGLAAMLRRHDVGNVCVTINCQDRPAAWKYYHAPSSAGAAATKGSNTLEKPVAVPPSRHGRPLLLSYMSSKDHWDVPCTQFEHTNSRCSMLPAALGRLCSERACSYMAHVPLLTARMYRSVDHRAGLLILGAPHEDGRAVVGSARGHLGTG